MTADSVPVVLGHARTGIRALAVGNRTFVPARGVFERLGARVSYTPPRVFVRRGDDAIAILHLDTRTAVVRGEPRVLDAPPFVRDRRVYVPLRLVSEILGAHVSYTSRPRTVRITPAAPPYRPRAAHLALPPAIVPPVRPVAASAPTLRPVPARRAALPWLSFLPLALVLGLAGAFAVALRRRRRTTTRSRAVHVRSETVRIPLHDVADERNAT